ncbi:MAG TPA: hypothetical protein PKV97_00280 [Thauera aminoaromatica]|nr:hypothetical protein [Thauera aminoaromatica]
MISNNNPFRWLLERVKPLEQLPEKFLDGSALLAKGLAEKGFEQQTDPYGQWWAPTVTGRSFDQRDGLKNALRVSPYQLRNLSLLQLNHYAYQFHQRGSVYVWGSIPARLMVPVVSRGLGRWAPDFHELARRIFERLVMTPR